MIKVNAIGRLTSDVNEIKGKDKVFNSFSLACRVGKDSTTFIDCFAFTDTIGKYCKKGDQLMVTGDLTTDEYENKDGKKVTKLKLTVDGFEFVGSKKE